MAEKQIDVVSPVLGVKLSVPAGQVDTYVALGYRQARRPSGEEPDSPPRPPRKRRQSEGE
ncbi:MAG TPA: hypothetical protein VK053_19295 [Jiangellaceae bacterium]|nr:hypothetical protein [Jiangellaceae bacterium]